MLESLESRQMFAASFVDTSYGSSGATTLRFKTTAADQLIRGTELASTSTGSSYVLARFENSVQIRRLNAQGQLDTNWGARNQILVFPTADRNDPAKIEVDENDRLLVLVGSKLYRFGGFGTLDTAFGGTGSLNLSDFSGNIDFDLDSGSRIYVTGSTPGGSAMLVERFISRGKLDRTFDGDGKSIAPLPVKTPALKKPGAQGQFVRVLDSGDVMLAGSLRASGYGSGVEAARFNSDGSIDTGYGAGTGVASQFGASTSELSTSNARAVSVLPSGAVSFYVLTEDSLGGTSPVRESFLFSQSGATLDAERTVNDSVAVSGTKYLGLTDAVLYGYTADNDVDTAFNNNKPVYGLRAIDVLEDDSVLIGNIQTNGLRVTVAKLQPSIFGVG